MIALLHVLEQQDLPHSILHLLPLTLRVIVHLRRRVDVYLFVDAPGYTLAPLATARFIVVTVAVIVLALVLVRLGYLIILIVCLDTVFVCFWALYLLLEKLLLGFMLPFNTISLYLGFPLFLSIEVLLCPFGDNLLVFEVDLFGVAKASKERLDQQHAADALLVRHLDWGLTHLESIR